jgi:delta-aminolevulinic acid dehydratase/porphobilinogen synthase
MLYAYQENGEGELTVADGTDVTIVEPDGMYLDACHILDAISRFANTSPQMVPGG